MSINFLFILSSLKVFCALFMLPFVISSLFPQGNDNKKKAYVFLVSFAISPLLVSYFYALLLRIMPGRGGTFYDTLMVITFFTIFIVFLKHIRSSYHLLISLLKALQPTNKRDKILASGVSILLTLLFIFILATPLIGNDPLEYFHLSKLILEKKSLAFYPLLDGEGTKGFIAPWTHPLGYPSWLAFMSNGISQADGLMLAKASTFFFTVSIVLSLVVISFFEKLTYRYAASLIYLAIPLCFIHAIYCHVDSLRISLFLSAAIATYIYLQDQNFKNAAFLGGVLGCSWFAHSTGSLTVLVMLGTVFLKGKMKNNVAHVCLILAIITLIIFPDLLYIYKKTGNLIADRENIKTITLLKEEFYLYLSAKRTPKDVLIDLFTDISIYGFTYWFLLAGLLVFLTKITYSKSINIFDFVLGKKENFLNLSVFMLIFFFAGVILTLLLGSLVFVVNIRYIFHPIALVSLIAAFSLFFTKPKVKTP